MTRLLTQYSAEIRGLKDIDMVYTNFDLLVTRPHGIVVEGWPLEKFVKPSALGSQLDMLRSLRDSIVEGRVYFRKMESEEHKAWVKKFDEKDPTAIPTNTRERANLLCQERINIWPGETTLSNLRIGVPQVREFKHSLSA